MAKLKENQIVVLRNGKVGVVTGFLGKPAQVVFDSFSKPARSFDEKTLAVSGNNRNYDIVEVYSAKEDVEFKDVFKKSFKLDELKRVWREK